MKGQYTYYDLGSVPGLSSQTTSEWPTTIPFGDNALLGDVSSGYNVDSQRIDVPHQQAWDEASREVFIEYAEAWEKLKNL